MTTRERRRGERGAVAIMVALLAVMLLSVSALTVDIGQAWVAKHDVQKSADFSALAGGIQGDLPTPTTTGTCAGGVGRLSGPQAVASSQAVKDAASYLNTAPYNFGTSAANLVDCNMSNGEVIFGSVAKQANGQWNETYDNTLLTVFTPPHRVDFGFARIMGFTGVNVQEQATVGLYSQLLQRTLPYYAAQGCDYGEQTIAQPSNGLSASAINLNSPSDNNNALLNTLVTTPASNPATVAYPIAGPTPPTPLTINGTGFRTGGTVSAVGFFESGTTSAGPAPTTVAVTAAMVNAAGTQIVLPDISSAALAQDTWYVRVKINGVWSPVSVGNGPNPTLNALPLTVGTPSLVCSQGSNVGNFGALLLPNNSAGAPNGQTDNIAFNVAAGLQYPLDYYPNPGNPSDFTCSNNSAQGGITWPGTATKLTNCVDTKTGNIAADSAYEGLLTGVAGKPGLLAVPGAGAPNTGCNRTTHAPATTVFQSQTVNNDTLSCFFLDDTTRIGDIDNRNYNGPAVFDTSIFTSPRFVYVPVLGVTPSGGNDKYQIVDFRPGFISDQQNSASRLTPEASCTSNGCNGLTLTSNGNGLLSLQIVLINPKALPQCPDTICTDVKKYGGQGAGELRLIN